MLREWIPYCLYWRLFGDRRRFGTRVQEEDEDYAAWQKCMGKFYVDTQKKGIGKVVNHWGFRILEHVDLASKAVLEIGPGIIDHTRVLARDTDPLRRRGRAGSLPGPSHPGFAGQGDPHGGGHPHRRQLPSLRGPVHGYHHCFPST